MDCLFDVICVLFLLCLPHRLSSVSVVFDFNASLNDAAPLSSIPLPVDFYENRKGWVVDVQCRHVKRPLL